MTREQGVWCDDDDATPGGDIHRQQRLRRDRSSRCSDRCSHLLNARALGNDGRMPRYNDCFAHAFALMPATLASEQSKVAKAGSVITRCRSNCGLGLSDLSLDRGPGRWSAQCGLDIEGRKSSRFVVEKHDQATRGIEVEKVPLYRTHRFAIVHYWVNDWAKDG